ncbi:MAG: hypothetical protein ACR2J8_16020, partial [Thermomicrobiales bacterium]
MIDERDGSSKAGRRKLAAAMLAIMAVLALAAAIRPVAQALGMPFSLSAQRPAALAAEGDGTLDCDPEWRVVVKGVEMCSHGPDPAPPGQSRTSIVPPVPEKRSARVLSATPWCEGDGVSGKRVQMLYVRETSTDSKYGSYLNTFRTLAAEMDAIYSTNALMTGPD